MKVKEAAEPMSFETAFKVLELGFKWGGGEDKAFTRSRFSEEQILEVYKAYTCLPLEECHEAYKVLLKEIKTKKMMDKMARFRKNSKIVKTSS